MSACKKAETTDNSRNTENTNNLLTLNILFIFTTLKAET